MFKDFFDNLNHKKLKDSRFEFLFEGNSDEIVVFDTETTGLNPKIDDIVSIGAVKIKDNKILLDSSFEIYIKQKQAISSESIKVHQIRNCDLHEALELEDAIDKFLYYIGNAKLVGYYLEFDVAMINKYIKKMYGIKLPNQQEEVSAIYYDKKINSIPQGNIDLRFDTITKNLDLPPLKAHNAINDAIMTAIIYLKLKQTTKI
ncbi:MAG: 3'-5' exonuclease [Sulfurovaceae bacterium]|nr:3'-5' exonuclease [Sulfurovaceae bacterium]MDD5549322.1 3'-5' exonuclease [Sulfurovaceae bacterium]